MFVLSSRAKALGAILIVGVASFGITAALVTAASAQAATPSASASTSSATPTSPVSPTAVPELAIGPVTAIASGQDISFPVDAYKANSASENLVLSAEYKTMKSCIARYGMTFEPPASAWKVPATNHDYDRLFGLINLVEAQKYGYHTGETLLPDGEAVPHSKPAADPSESAPNYLAVAMGDPSVPKVNGLQVPNGGCISEARSKLGDTPAAQALYENTVDYGLAQSDADRRVVAAFGSWSTCMKNAGFSYATPMDAIDDPRWATTTPSGTEVKAATADVECKVSTNLTGLRAAVATAWQHHYINAHAAQFAAMKSGFDQQVAKARAILQK